MNKNNKVNGLIDGVVYNEEEEKKLHHSEDENFIYKRGKTGTWAQSKKDGNMYWQQYGGNWVEI